LKLLKKILLVEDDTRVCSFINKGLTENGFDVTVAMDGTMGLQLAQNHSYDLLILDIMLPGINGLELCRKVRHQDGDVPILFLTAMGSAENVVIGLESGADDYLVKPFKFIELLARIKTLMRRTGKTEENRKVDHEIYRFADLILDDTSKTVTRNGHEISLTSTEFRLLLMFMKFPRRVLSRGEMLDQVWGVNFDMGTNVVDVYVNYIRKKLDKYGDQKLIHTVIGMGYVLKEDQ
jgi:two-component system copper resistance phosphate regulon response regulator CusR